MDVEYENYAHRASARGDDAETDEEIVIKYRRHRVDHHPDEHEGSEETIFEPLDRAGTQKTLPPSRSTVGKLIHGAKSWYRQIMGQVDTETLKHKIGEGVDQAGKKIEQEGEKVTDYVKERVEKASEASQHAFHDAKESLDKGKEQAHVVDDYRAKEAIYASARAKEKAFEAVHKAEETGNTWTSWVSDTVSSAWESTKSRFESFWLWNQIGNQRRKAGLDKLNESRKLQKEMEQRKEELRKAGKAVKETAEAGKEKVEELLNESAEFGKQKVAGSAGWLKESAERQKEKIEEAVHDVKKMAHDTVEAGKGKAEAIAHEAADKTREGVDKAQNAAGWIKQQVDKGAEKVEDAWQEMAEKAKEKVEEGTTKAKEGVQETAEWLQNKAEAGKAKVEGVVHNVQDEVHAARAGMEAAKEKAKENVRSAAGRVKETVVDGIHRVETVGENIKEAVEHGGEKIYHGGKNIVKEGAEHVTRPFVRDTQLHQRKLHGEYFTSDNVRIPKQVLSVGDVAPYSSFYASILGVIFLVLAYRVWRNRERTGIQVSDHHSVVHRHRVTSIANVVKEKPKKGQSPSQETLSEITYVEDTAVSQDLDLALLHESVESLSTFTQNTAIAVILLALNEIAGYRLPLSYLYIFYIVGSLLNAFGGYSTEVEHGRRQVGQTMVWMVIAASCLLNFWAGISDMGLVE